MLGLPVPHHSGAEQTFREPRKEGPEFYHPSLQKAYRFRSPKRFMPTIGTRSIPSMANGWRYREDFPGVGSSEQAAPYLASRGLTRIQHDAEPGLSDDKPKKYR